MTNHLQHQQHRTVDLRIPDIEKYAFCMCLHVKPTTIFIAVFKLIQSLLSASVLLNGEFALNDQSNDELSLDDRQHPSTTAFKILAQIIMASVSAVGIYSVISGRAAILMPLYGMLLVDFFYTLQTLYTRDRDPDSFHINPQYFDRFYDHAPQIKVPRYPIVIFSTFQLIVNIYFLCVIWKCYRYLRLIELVRPIRLAEIHPHLHQSAYPIVRVIGGSLDSTDLSSAHNIAPPPYESLASSMKPPNYEEAMKSNQFGITNQSLRHQQIVVFPNSPCELNSSARSLTQPEGDPSNLIVPSLPSTPSQPSHHTEHSPENASSPNDQEAAVCHTSTSPTNPVTTENTTTTEAATTNVTKPSDT